MRCRQRKPKNSTATSLARLERLIRAIKYSVSIFFIALSGVALHLNLKVELKSGNFALAKMLFTLTSPHDINMIYLLDGEFGAMMKVNLVNDGPVTLIIESNNKKQDE